MAKQQEMIKNLNKILSENRESEGNRHLFGFILRYGICPIKNRTQQISTLSDTRKMENPYIGKDGRDYYTLESLEQANRQFNASRFPKIPHKSISSICANL